jgi:TP901 family phage tail tape measure protein
VSVIAEAFVRLRPDTTTFRAEAQTGVAASLRGTDAALLGASRSALKFGGAMAGITTAAALAEVALREIIVGTGEFERELDVLQVVSGATADEMERVSTVAKQLGADVTLPGTSAGDAAVAMNELSKAGLSLQDTLGGARGVLQLAAAGELQVGEAASLAGSALNAFGLSGDQASHVADLLAGASIAAQGEVADMGLALQQSGAVARQAGLSIEQTVGAISLLAKNGILGSDAGTSLRTTLLRLIPTTKEARQFVQALGIQMDENATLGEQLPSIIQQYHDALAKLNPELQQVALTQIFGTDAIRAAAIFAREGAAGYEEMVRAADRLGAANELAGAKTEGVLGASEGLKSSLSTLAIEIGTVVTPAITDFLNELTGGVGEVTKFVTEVKKLGDLELPDWLDPTDTSVGEALGKGLSLGAKALAGQLFLPARIKQTMDLLDRLRGEAEKPLQLGIGDLASEKAALAAEAGAAGVGIGREFGEGTKAGIEQSGPSAVDAARTVVQQVAQQGRDAVRNAIAGAQQSLASIGASLASDAGAVIEATMEQSVEKATAGAARVVSANQRRRQQQAIRDAEGNLAQALRNVPVMREIERIQAQLDRENRADDRTDVRRSLRDAREALRDAQRQAQTTGLDPQQQRARSRFLRPFVEEVQDAKGEVRRFNLEGRLDTLQGRLDRQTDDITENIDSLRDALQQAREALIASQASFSTGGVAASLRKAGEEQKRAVRQGIDDAIQAFNDGLITLPELNRRLAKILEANGVDYRNAGTVLGTAFVRGFEEELKGIGAQARAILAGPFVPGAGLRPTVVAPSVIARTARLNDEQAQRELQEALVEQGDSQVGLLTRIAKAVEGTGRGAEVAEAHGQTTRRSSAADQSQARTGTEVIPFRVGRNR